MDEAKVTINHFSQRGLLQLGTVKYRTKLRGQVNAHFTVSSLPAGKTTKAKQTNKKVRCTFWLHPQHECPQTFSLTVVLLTAKTQVPFHQQQDQEE